jgi:hypothetical protein
MNRHRRWLPLAAVAGVWALALGCEEGLLHQPAPPAPAEVAISASILAAAGGEVAAFGRADRLLVRVLGDADVRLEELLAFDGAASETRVPVRVPLQRAAETVTLEVELQLGDRPLFRGSGAVELTSGRATPVEVALSAIVASVHCDGPPVELTAFGETAELAGAALFASGDTVNVPLAWSSSDPTVAQVDPSSPRTAVATALRDGTAQALCAAGGLTDQRALQVHALVRSVTVSPATATVVVGATQRFNAWLGDARGNEIPGRVVTWSSGVPGVAAVDAAGLATGVSPGTAQVVASSEGVTGQAQLTVTPPPPLVVTGAASAVGSSSAVLNGTVNPRGFASSAWFEWSAQPALTAPGVTTQQAVGNGTAPVAVSATLSGLLPNETYHFRQVAVSAGGRSDGEVRSFFTSAPPTVRSVSSQVGCTAATLHGASNPQGAATQVWFEWSSSAALAQAQSTAAQGIGSGRSEVPFSAAVPNPPLGVTYYFRGVAQNAAGTVRGQILTFHGGGAPTATTDAPVAGASSAELQGAANPNRVATQGWFDWSTSPSLATFSRTPMQALGSGAEPVAFADMVTGLQTGTTYFVRAGASNACGTSLGAIHAFTAEAQAPSARPISGAYEPDSDARLDMVAGVNANGAATRYRFEFSESADFFGDTGGGNWESEWQSLEGGSAEVIVTGSVFTQGTGGYFRVVAQNAVGTTVSAAMAVAPWEG